jgi:hypothetical protein
VNEVFAPQTLPGAFREFAPFTGLCRFRDCAHIKEEGCAVLGAVKAGAVSPSRHRSYTILYEQVKEAEKNKYGKKRKAKRKPQVKKTAESPLPEVRPFFEIGTFLRFNRLIRCSGIWSKDKNGMRKACPKPDYPDNNARYVKGGI